ncbi:MAG: alpha/beta hydrolase, partial [Myxococcaceae bacterium]|nr:alpha/beta hydrolase [Myxococcaceae bacterium]
METRGVETPVGVVRVFDSASDKPCVVIVPDGPNVIEHYAAIVERLSLWGEQDRTHRGTDPCSLRDCALQTQILRCETLGHFPDLEAPER